jgi:hypothetical protein
MADSGPADVVAQLLDVTLREEADIEPTTIIVSRANLLARPERFELPTLRFEV